MPQSEQELSADELKAHVAEQLDVAPEDILAATTRDEGLRFVTSWGSRGTLTADGITFDLGPEAPPEPVVAAPALPAPEPQADEEEELQPLAEDEAPQDESESTDAGEPDHFEVFKGGDGQFYIRRMAANGENVAVSEGHKRRKDAVAEAEREADGADVTIV